MPSLRKRLLKSGTVVWDIRYYSDGHQKSFHIGETDRRTAEKVYHKFCNNLVEGKLDGIVHPQPPEPAGPRLSDLAQHAKTYAESNKSVKTLEREQQALQRLIRTVGDIFISDVTPTKVEEYKAERLKEASPSTINIEIRVLNTALNQAVELRWLKESPSAYFKQLRMPESEPLNWLDDNQIAILLSTNDAEFRSFMLFLLHTGCRRNEALGVTWNDIDMTKRQIVIRGEVGKMGKRRTIPINDALFALLASWTGKREGCLFPGYSPNQISMKFRRWIKQLALPDGTSIHSLRATFACQLIARGIDIYTVSKLLGHSSVKVTEKHYLALSPGHIQDAVNRLDFGEPQQ